MMKTLKSKFSGKFNWSVVIKTVSFVVALTFVATSAYAAGEAGMDSFDKVIGVLAKWAGRVGLVVAFFGGIQTALGFKNDDADAKVRGMKTLAAGFMVFGISESLSLFGLTN